MDIFLEYLMKKKPTWLDFLKKLGIVLAALVLCYLVLIGFWQVQFLRAYIFIALAGVVYFAMIFMRNFDLEYEYIFTNGDLDIDKVKARKTRKRMVSLSCKNIELMASDKNMTYKRNFEDGAFAQKYDAVFNPEEGRVYHVIFSKNGERSLLTFQPPVKLLEAMRKMNPRCVNVDVEDTIAE
ncbi:MAG: hypothetical protein E7400_02790 [Ruminococcaceae bacterium]|nr:hypothetical protein [Oscillospiraceae bacterium]